MRNSAFAFVTAVAIGIAAGAAKAHTIGFEDIVNPGCCSFLPPGYHGFDWGGTQGNLSWVIGAQSETVFLGQQAYSGENYAWSFGVSDLSMTAVGAIPFDLNSLFARSGASALTMTAHGFLGATEIFTQTLDLISDYQLFALNFTGITSFTITNGVGNILVDDITVNAPPPVPLPAALPLFATVLAGGGLIAWRRKRKAAKVAA